MITHIIQENDWEEAKKKGIYDPPSLGSEGFIHCSNIDQVVDVANKNFDGEEDLLLLLIDEKKVESKVVYEDLYSEGEKYPHIYGPLNIEAVQEVHSFLSDDDGRFKLPGSLR